MNLPIQRIMEEIKKRQESSTSSTTLQTKEQKKTWECDKCRDAGMIIERTEDEEGNIYDSARQCSCIRREIQEKRWSRAGLNPNTTNMTLDNFKIVNADSKALKETAIKYINEFQDIKNTRANSVSMLGQVGSGKSHITVAIGLELMKKDVEVIYFQYATEIQAIKRNRFDEEYHEKQLSKFKNCELLLIDDLFKKSSSDDDIRIMFDIINYRYVNMLPIIVSSELDLGQLNNIDEAVGSRIYEMTSRFSRVIKKDRRKNYRYR